MMAAVRDQGPARLHGQFHHHLQLDRLLLEDHLASRDPGDVQQVIHHASHVLDLILDDLDRPLEVRAVEPFDLHDLHGVADRRQGIAQLVREHGEELVLPLVGLLEDLLHPLPPRDLVLQFPPTLLVLPGDEPRFGELALGADLIQDPGDDRLEVVEEILGLGHEVPHPRPQRLDDQVLLLHAGDQDRRHVVPGGLDLPEELQSAGAGGEVLVEDDQLDPALGDLPEAFLGRRRRDHGVTRPLQPDLLQAGDPRIILHEQDRRPSLQSHA